MHVPLGDGVDANATATADRLAELLRRVGRNRDRNAFDELFETFGPRCRESYVARGVAAEVADELCQDAMAAIWAQAAAFDGRGGALAWLDAVAEAQWAADDRLRRFDGSQSGPMQSIWRQKRRQVSTDPDQALRAHRLRRAFAGLPIPERALLTDVVVRGLSHSAIARGRGLPLGTVKKHLRRGLSRLRDAMRSAE
jgi:RNA polymerase sigma-70 factor (ECF subfamily)